MGNSDARLSKHGVGLRKRAGEILRVCAFADASLSKMQSCFDGRPEEGRRIRACLKRCGIFTDVASAVRYWHAYRLLQGASLVDGEPSNDPWFPIGHYKRAWSLLVSLRLSPGGLREWSLLPGMEEDCREAYRSAAEHGIDASACRDGCRELLRSWALRGLGARAKGVC